ncbi:hypothetical protein ACFL6P_07515 [Candidatus Latescibacterota bacterium]
MELLKTQKNEVFEILNKLNLPLSYFKWLPDFQHGETISKLNYKGGEFYFVFDIRGNSFNHEYSPGTGKRISKNSLPEWGITLSTVLKWAITLKPLFPIYTPKNACIICYNMLLYNK